MDDGTDGWMDGKCFTKNDHNVLYYKTYMHIPLINACKNDEESPFDTCLEKGISIYIPWKRIGK
jgi:hypothetical protein